MIWLAKSEYRWPALCRSHSFCVNQVQVHAWQLRVFFASKGLSLKVRMELGSNEAIKQAIASGLGVSVMSQYALTLEGSDGLLQPLDVVGFPLRRQWYAAYLSGKHLSVVANAFLAHVINHRK
ncbi:MAG: LysR substrate-binding domain-containing protein [Burkholderiaceae bacterium]